MVTQSKKRYRYLNHKEVPCEFQELFIYTGYRCPNSSFRSCIKSIFCLDNNETINFWTHFFPFLFAFVTFMTHLFNRDFTNQYLTHPLIIYLFTICFYLLMSSMAHLLNCMSPIARHICFILDYLSISIYGMGCAIAYKSYTLSTIKSSQNDTIFDYYILLVLVVSLISNIMSCSSRFILSPFKRNILRAFSFVFQYIFVNLPLLYRYMYFYHPRIFKNTSFIFSFLSSSDTTIHHNEHYSLFKIRSDVYYLIQLMAAIASAILYIFHVPERFWPGKFDILGQSHQIFHLTSFVCSWSQFTALKYDMSELVEMVNVIEETSFSYSTVPFVNKRISNSLIMFLCLASNFVILVYYYYRAVYFNPWLKLNSNGKHLDARVNGKFQKIK